MHYVSHKVRTNIIFALAFIEPLRPRWDIPAVVSCPIEPPPLC